MVDLEGLPDKIRHLIFTANNRASYDGYDPVDPRDYVDKYAMTAAVYAMYRRWNSQYLE